MLCGITSSSHGVLLKLFFEFDMTFTKTIGKIQNIAQLLLKILGQHIHAHVSFLLGCWPPTMNYSHSNDRHINLGFYIVMCVHEFFYLVFQCHLSCHKPRVCVNHKSSNPSPTAYSPTIGFKLWLHKGVGGWELGGGTLLPLGLLPSHQSQ